MFDDFHGQNHIELLSGVSKYFRWGVAIIDFKPLGFSMQTRDRDVSGRCVCTDHCRTKARHGLGQKSPSAADIQEAKPGEWFRP